MVLYGGRKMIKIIAPISAIPSWEGFEYQRHMALFIALKYIWNEIKSDNIKVIDLYKLGIEGEEDFSIIKGDNYISLHQVKAGSIDLKDNDKACFVLSALQYKVKNAYFHIIPEATIDLDFVEKTVQSIDCLLFELNKKIKTKKEFSDEITLLETTHRKKIKKNEALYKQTEAKYILIDKINNNMTKGSLYKILSYICDGNKEKDDVIKFVASVKNELLNYKEQLNGKTDSDIWSVYDDQFITSASIITNSCKIIQKILKKINPEGSIYYDQTYYQFVYDKIVIFSKEVISEHNTRSKNNSCKIEFSRLLDLLVQDHKANSNTTEYQYYELLELIKDIFEKYPNSARTNCVHGGCMNCTSIDQCNLYQQMLTILNKSYEDKKDFLYKLLLRTPQNNLPRDAVINNLFITLLKKIERLKYYDSNVILAKKNKEIYRLTLDENEYIEDFETQLHKELSLNNVDKFLIYESDVLITDRINKPDYRYNQNNFNVMGTKELNEIVDITSDSVERQRINYNKSKFMRIISKDIAEGELIDNE